VLCGRSVLLPNEEPEHIRQDLLDNHAKVTHFFVWGGVCSEWQRFVNHEWILSEEDVASIDFEFAPMEIIRLKNAYLLPNWCQPLHGKVTKKPRHDISAVNK
jgi:hypothetical protein